MYYACIYQMLICIMQKHLLIHRYCQQSGKRI